MNGMNLPSGRRISGEDVLFIMARMKQQTRHKVKAKGKAKGKPKVKAHCWYCSNGHHRELIAKGMRVYLRCECGATDVPMLRKTGHKQGVNAKLGAEALAAWRRTTVPEKLAAAKTKRII